MRPYRKERVASAVRDIVSQALAHRLNDPRIAPLTTITRVEVTADLLIAKVYVSIPGDAAAENKTMAGLKHAAGFVQGIMARELNLRLCPELRFLVDEAWKGARRTLALLDENRRNLPPSPPIDAGTEIIDKAAVEAGEDRDQLPQASEPTEGGR